MRARAPTRPKKPTGPTKRRPRPPGRSGKPSPASRPGKPEVRIFISYSHVDREARRKLETHLAPLKSDNVATWYDDRIEAGDSLDTEIARALREAHVFVGLISSDYLASRYCWEIEYRRAMNRRARGTMRVVAVVVRPCDWKSTTAAGFKLLPDDGRSLQEWRSVDAALVDVVRGIRRVVASVRKGMAGAEPGSRSVAPVGKPPAKAKRPGRRSPARPPSAPTAKPKGNRTTRKKRTP